MAKILDVTCGSRQIWFQKNEPHTTYCDIRQEEWEGDFGKERKGHRHLVIDPDIKCSFTELPFEDNTFNLVVFDPPHITELSENAWMRKAYGSLDGDWKPMLNKGFKECMRVLVKGGGYWYLNGPIYQSAQGISSKCSVRNRFSDTVLEGR